MSVDGAGLSNVPGAIRHGRNSGHQAVAMAHLFGARRIVLLGYDFQRTFGKAHWHGEHPARLSRLGNLERWARQMETLAADLASAGALVVNATRESALRCFPRMTLDEAMGVCGG